MAPGQLLHATISPRGAVRRANIGRNDLPDQVWKLSDARVWAETSHDEVFKVVPLIVRVAEILLCPTSLAVR